MTVVAWLIVVVLLVALFGLGDVLEAAFWLMMLIAVLIVAAGVAVSRALRR